MVDVSLYECPCGCTNLRRLCRPRLAAETHQAWKEQEAARIFGLPVQTLRSRQNGKTTATNYLTQASSPTNAEIMADLTMGAKLATKVFDQKVKGTTMTNKQTSGTNRRAALEHAVYRHTEITGTDKDVLETADRFYAWLEAAKPVVEVDTKSVLAKAAEAIAEALPQAKSVTTEWITCGTPPVRVGRTVLDNGQAYENWTFEPIDHRFANQGYTHRVTTTHPSNEAYKIYALKRVTRVGNVPTMAEYRIMKQRQWSLGLPTGNEPVVIGAFVLNLVPV